MIGHLVIDGADIPDHERDRWVAAAVTDLRESDVPSGACVEVATGSPLAVAVIAAAADTLDLPLTFTGRAPGDRASTPSPPAGARVDADADGRPRVRPAPGTDGRAPLPPAAGAVFWTSGSTGEPRAVVVARDTLVRQAEVTANWLELDGDDTLYTALPVDHAYGHGLVQMWLRLGLRLALDTSFHAQAAAHRLGTATSFDGVPGMYRTLLGLARTDPDVRRALAELRLRNCGGDVLGTRLAEEFVGAVGEPILDGYGLSEAGPNVAVARPGTVRTGAIAPPLPGVSLAVDGRAEEILVDSPDLMLGYYGDDDATAAAFDDEGRLRTGDRGRVDPDGQLVVLGRIKDSIIVQGETFAPASIESTLCRCSGVRDAGVVGVPTSLGRGDRIAAFLVPESGGPPAAEVVREHCRRHLPPLLRPGFVEWVAELPRLPTGKVDRRDLRARLPVLPGSSEAAS